MFIVTTTSSLGLYRPVLLRNENLEVRRAQGARIYRSVCEDECRAGCDDFHPPEVSFRIRALKRAKDQVFQRRNHLRIWYSGTTDFHSVSVDVNCFIRAANDHGNWAAGRIIRIPVESPGSNGLTLLTGPGKEETRMHGCRGRRVHVRNDNSRAFHCDAEQELGQFKRKPDASMGVRITWQVTGVQRNAAPGDALHVRHLCAFVDAGGMMHLFFQNCEHAGGSTMT